MTTKLKTRASDTDWRWLEEDDRRTSFRRAYYGIVVERGTVAPAHASPGGRATSSRRWDRIRRLCRSGLATAAVLTTAILIIMVV